jgi:hypothetical protein
MPTTAQGTQGVLKGCSRASGSTEVGNAHVPAALHLAQQHVRRLDVAMHDLRAFGAHSPEGRGKSRGRRGRECRGVLQTRPIRCAFPAAYVRASLGRWHIKNRDWLPRVRTKQQPPPPGHKTGAGRALCACTTSKPVATSRRMYSTSETCGPKQIWATWRATGGGLASWAGPGHPCTLRVRRWSSSRLRAERSQRSITSSRCAGVSALRTPTRAWAEV